MEDTERNANYEIGALSHIIATLIAGTTNKHFVVDSIESSSILSDSTKHLIVKLTKEELGRKKSSDTPNNTESGYLPMPSLNESAINTLKSDFKRFV